MCEVDIHFTHASLTCTGHICTDYSETRRINIIHHHGDAYIHVGADRWKGTMVTLENYERAIITDFGQFVLLTVGLHWQCIDMCKGLTGLYCVAFDARGMTCVTLTHFNVTKQLAK